MTTIYWTSTLLLSGFLLLSSYTYFFSQATIEGLRDLGFPDFFRVQLGVLKLLAVAALLYQKDVSPVKEWAYAGVACFLITAIVAHVAHRDSAGIMVLLGLLCVALVASRYSLGT
ncbi:MAG: DoxX family protein [Bacteroidota bacterium]